MAEAEGGQMLAVRRTGTFWQKIQKPRGFIIIGSVDKEKITEGDKGCGWR